MCFWGVLRDLEEEMGVNKSYFIVYMYDVLKEKNINKYIQKEPQCWSDKCNRDNMVWKIILNAQY